ncbi:hypothetical protein HME9304_02644 [Flagellimonas maritima]|uniref:Uncharacterized protein n=1 Tax=Flagellimonas maritima TaxID=1383885 RepID=A0A2Z4LWG4_9FLAO|nr:hypothetical protein HME9304_02644 [Allomuricauda aurantiaca]
MDFLRNRPHFFRNRAPFHINVVKLFININKQKQRILFNNIFEVLNNINLKIIT